MQFDTLLLVWKKLEPGAERDRVEATLRTSPLFANHLEHIEAEIRTQQFSHGERLNSQEERVRKGKAKVGETIRDNSSSSKNGGGKRTRIQSRSENILHASPFPTVARPHAGVLNSTATTAETGVNPSIIQISNLNHNHSIHPSMPTALNEPNNFRQVVPPINHTPSPLVDRALGIQHLNQNPKNINQIHTTTNNLSPTQLHQNFSNPRHSPAHSSTNPNIIKHYHNQASTILQNHSPLNQLNLDLLAIDPNQPPNPLSLPNTNNGEEEMEDLIRVPTTIVQPHNEEDPFECENGSYGMQELPLRQSPSEHYSAISPSRDPRLDIPVDSVVSSPCREYEEKVRCHEEAIQRQAELEAIERQDQLDAIESARVHARDYGALCSN